MIYQPCSSWNNWLSSFTCMWFCIKYQDFYDNNDDFISEFFFATYKVVSEIEVAELLEHCCNRTQTIRQWYLQYTSNGDTSLALNNWYILGTKEQLEENFMWGVIFVVKHHFSHFGLISRYAYPLINDLLATGGKKALFQYKDHLFFFQL